MIMVLELGGRNARAYLPEHITRAFSHTNCLLADKSRGAVQQQPNEQPVLHCFFFSSSFFSLETLP